MIKTINFVTYKNIKSLLYIIIQPNVPVIQLVINSKSLYGKNCTNRGKNY